MIELKAKMWKNTPETGSNCEGALNKSKTKWKKKPGHCTMVECWARFSHFAFRIFIHFHHLWTVATMEQKAHGSALAKTLSFFQKLKVYAYYNFNRQQFNGIQDAGYFLFINVFGEGERKCASCFRCCFLFSFVLLGKLLLFLMLLLFHLHSFVRILNV